MYDWMSRVSVRGGSVLRRGFSGFFSTWRICRLNSVARFTQLTQLKENLQTWMWFLKHPFLKRHTICHSKPLDLCQFFLDHTYFRTMELRQRELVGVSNIQSYWEATTLLGILKRVNNTVPYHSPVRKNDFTSKIWSNSYFYGMTFYRDFLGSPFMYITNTTIYRSPFFLRGLFLRGIRFCKVL